MNQKCSSKDFFDVPHKSKPMSAKDIIKKFPDFAKLFDGEAEENTLSFYWKKNKETGIYEFKSTDDEEEVAELMEVKILDGEDTIEKEAEEETENKKHENRELTKEEIEEFKEHMKDIKEGLEKFK